MGWRNGSDDMARTEAALLRARAAFVCLFVFSLRGIEQKAAFVCFPLFRWRKLLPNGL